MGFRERVRGSEGDSVPGWSPFLCVYRVYTRITVLQY